MKKMMFLCLGLGLLMASCNECVECNGTKYCKEAGAVYTNDQGNEITWAEYAAEIQQNCQ